MGNMGEEGRQLAARLEIRLVVARAFGVGLVNGEAEAGTGHEVIEGAVFARGMMDTIGGDAAQTRLLGDRDQLVQQRGGIAAGGGVVPPRRRAQDRRRRGSGARPPAAAWRRPASRRRISVPRGRR